MLQGLGTLRGMVLEHLGFDATREPIAAMDMQTGTLSPAVQSRRLALLTASGFYNPATPGAEAPRTPAISKGLRTQAINAAAPIWTPAGGKKFRLMAYKLEISGNAALAAATECLFKLQDVATDIYGGAGDDVLIPAAAGAGPTLYVGPWTVLPGNGYLSTVANNVLNLAATGAAAGLTSGHVDVIALGTEE